MTPTILVLNVGSSSIKFALYPMDEAQGAHILNGQITGMSEAPTFRASTGADGFGEIAADEGFNALIERLLGWVAAQPGLGPIQAVGHRVVHGGAEFSEAVRIDADVMTALSALEPLAPLHQPHNLAGIRAVAARHPDVAQIACFDTAFHRTQDRIAQLFALPRSYADEGILRYGFHGLSYDYISRALPEHLGDAAGGRVVVAHLGAGASMCAMRARRSVATTMGFTALDGLVMGRRCGTLDAGVILHLLQQKNMTPNEIEDLLYQRSGLLGVSGLSRDMRVLEESDDARAQEAIDLFCYRAVTALGGLVAALGGLDALVFTAGIGENSPTIRRKICEKLGWLGVSLDDAANARNATRIGTPTSQCAALVIPTDEEIVIAQAARRLLR